MSVPEEAYRTTNAAKLVLLLGERLADDLAGLGVGVGADALGGVAGVVALGAFTFQNTTQNKSTHSPNTPSRSIDRYGGC